MKVSTFATLVLTFLILQVFGQSQIRIGDKLPVLQFDHALSNANQPLSYSELEGKVIILDFWDIYCKSCIAAFPKMQQLQNQFQEDIQIILVTGSPADKVAALFERNGMDRSIRLPMIAGDTVLTRLFSFRTVPTHAWIGRDGRLVYFTNGTETNESNISAYLNGIDVQLPLKREYSNFNPSVPIAFEGNGRQLSHLRFYSMLFGRIDDEGEGSINVVDSVSGTVNGIRIFNSNLAEIYRYAWRDQLDPKVSTGYQSYGNLVFDVRDPRQFFFHHDHDTLSLMKWQRENTYCYDLRIPSEKADSLMVLMRSDLKRYFPYKVEVKKREVECIVVRQISDKKKLLSSAPQYLPGIVNQSDRFQLVHHNFSMLLFKINQFFGNQQGTFYPIFNDTDFANDDKIDLDIQGKLTDFSVFQKCLRAYGLVLSKEKRYIKVLVITD